MKKNINLFKVMSLDRTKRKITLKNTSCNDYITVSYLESLVVNIFDEFIEVQNSVMLDTLFNSSLLVSDGNRTFKKYR